MIKLALTLAGGILLLCGQSLTGPRAQAADAIVRPVAASHTCQQIRTCGEHGCGWRKACVRLCPDGISCYPLYGAYGPYGGVGFWGAYTEVGWYAR